MEICQTDVADEVCWGGSPRLMPFAGITDSEVYLISVPNAPQASTTNGTGYTIWRTANNRVGVCATDTELGSKICVKR